MKGNVRKMSGNRGMSNKTYRGRIYEFVKAEDEGKHGGNGGVYTVSIVNRKVESSVVAKFFEYNKDEKKKIKRYNRFKNEVRVIQELGEIKGIIKILDTNCLETVWFM